ncbi:MAG: dockerin type I domain-containing protein [Pseudomonadota bacterium]
MNKWLTAAVLLSFLWHVPARAASTDSPDLNGDGVIDQADFAVLKQNMYGPGPQGDINGDGRVDFADASLLKAATTAGVRAMRRGGIRRGQDGRVYFQPSEITPEYDGLAEFELWVDFSAEPAIGGGLDITFDPEHLRFEEFVFDAAFPDDPDLRRYPDLVDSNRLLGIAFGNFDFGITGPVRVGFVRFHTLVANTTGTIATGPNDVPAGQFVSFITFMGLNPSFESGTYTIQPGELSLAINLSRPAGTTTPGTEVTYEISIQNNGPNTFLEGSVSGSFSDMLEDFRWACLSSTGGSTCGGGGVIFGPFTDTPTIFPGGSVNYSVIGTIDEAATGTITAEITTQPIPGTVNTGDTSAIDEFVLTPEVNLAISKTDNTEVIPSGEPLQYIINVSNQGPSLLKDGLVSDVLPANLIDATWTCSATAGATCTAGPVAGDIADPVEISAGGSVTYVIDAIGNPEFDGTLENTVTVAVPAGTTNTGDSSATDTTILELPPAILLIDNARVKFGPTIIGTTTSRTVTISTEGSATPLELGQLSDPGLPYSISADDCSNSTLTIGESCNIEVEFSPDTQGEAVTTMSLASNDPVLPTVEILLGGVGTDQPMEVAVDIIPQTCPNPILLGSPNEQIVEVAILGSETLDVNTIDPASISFVGLCPLRSRVADVATPFFPLLGKEAVTDCNTLGADGFDDLVVQYDMRAFSNWLQTNRARGAAVLRVRAALLESAGGTPLIGEDVVLLIDPDTFNRGEDTP